MDTQTVQGWEVPTLVQVENPHIILQSVLDTYISKVRHLRIQPTSDSAGLQYIFSEKCTYKWTHAGQTCVVQGSTVHTHMHSKWKLCHLTYSRSHKMSARNPKLYSRALFLYCYSLSQGYFCFCSFLLCNLLRAWIIRYCHCRMAPYHPVMWIEHYTVFFWL